MQVIRTAGDELSVPLDQIGGQGVFVTAIETAVADGRVDAAVHSAKDMTSTMAPGLVLAAVPPRADPRDGLVGSTLAGLPPAAWSPPGRPGAGPNWPTPVRIWVSPRSGATWAAGSRGARTGRSPP